MQAFTFKIFFITLCCAVALANGQQCVKISNEYAAQIRAKVADATDIAVAAQKAKNPQQNIIGLALSGLILFLKTFLIPAWAGAMRLTPFLLNVIFEAFNGLNKGGLIGTLGGLARAAVIGLRQAFGQAGIDFLKVSDPKQNESVQKDIGDAVAIGIAKLDAESAGCDDVDADLYYVNELVRLLLAYVTALIPYLLTVLGSAIIGLLHDLTSGLLGGFKGLLDGLATGSIKAFGGFLSNVLA